MEYHLSGKLREVPQAIEGLAPLRDYPVRVGDGDARVAWSAARRRFWGSTAGEENQRVAGPVKE